MLSFSFLLKNIYKLKLRYMVSYIVLYFLTINFFIFLSLVFSYKNYWFFLWSFLFSIAFYFLLLPFFFFITSFITTIRFYKRIKYHSDLSFKKTGNDLRDISENMPLFLIKIIKNNLNLRVSEKIINTLLPKKFHYFLKQGGSIYFYQEEKINNFLNFSPNGISLIHEILAKSLKNEKDSGAANYLNSIFTLLPSSIYSRGLFSLLFFFNFLAGLIIVEYPAGLLLRFPNNYYDLSTEFILLTVLFVISLIFLIIHFFLFPSYVNLFFNKNLVKKVLEKKLILQNLAYERGGVTTNNDLLLPINLSILKEKSEKNLYPYVFTNFSEIFSFALLGVRVFLPDSLTSNIVLKIDSKGLTFFKIKDDKLEEIV